MTTCTGLVAVAMALAPAMAQAAMTSKTPMPAGTNSRTPVLHVKPGSTISPNVAGNNGQINGYTAETISPPGGSANTWEMGFNSTYGVSCGLFTCTITVNGSSYSQWLGLSPYNATSMGLTDNIYVNGIGVSLTISQDPGIGIYTTTNTVTYSTSVNNNWQIYHYFNNVGFISALIMVGPYETQTASATFGSTTFFDSIN